MNTPDTNTSTSLLTGFTPFGWHHLAVILVNIAVAWFIIAHARSRRGTPAELRIRQCWAWGTLAAGVLVGLYWMQPEHYSRGDSLPLHLCDIAALTSPFLMLSRRRWPKTLLFFWGIGLSTQGFITPTLEQGMLDPFYWLFWLQHLGVVGGGVYLAVVNGYRPGLRDVGVAFCATALLGGLMIPLNLALDVNYMYVGNQVPIRPTMIDHLGPWPLRLVWLGLLLVVAFLLTWAGSEMVRRVAGRGERVPRPCRP